MVSKMVKEEEGREQEGGQEENVSGETVPAEGPWRVNCCSMTCHPSRASIASRVVMVVAVVEAFVGRMHDREGVGRNLLAQDW